MRVGCSCKAWSQVQHRCAVARRRKCQKWNSDAIGASTAAVWLAQKLIVTTASTALVTHLIDIPSAPFGAQAVAMPHTGVFTDVSQSGCNSNASEMGDALNVLSRPGT